MCAQVCGPAVAARLSHRRVFDVVPELRRGVSVDEPQDLPAGESTADGDGQSVRLPPATQRFSERGWDPDSRAEQFNWKARGRGKAHCKICLMNVTDINLLSSPSFGCVLLEKTLPNALIRVRKVCVISGQRGYKRRPDTEL